MSSNRESIKKNFIMNVILTISNFMFPIITFPYISRILRPEGIGKITFATAIISYFQMIAQLGIPTYGIRACAKIRDDKIELTRIVHEILTINVVMNMIAYILLAIVMIKVPKIREERTLYIIISISIILNTIGVEWLYKALEQYTYIAIRSIIFKIVAVLAMYILVHTSNDYVIYGAITIFAASASNICNIINSHKYILFKKVDKYSFKRHLKPIAVFFAMACATMIYTHLDTVMLGFIGTESDVGYYNTAVRIKSILVSIVTSLGTVLLPRASYYIKNKKYEEYLKISKKAINFVLIAAIPMMTYFIIFAKQSILFISGIDYLDAVIPMQIIMPSILFIGLSNIIGMQMLVPLGKEKTVLISEIIGAIVDIISNIILIPIYGVVGAAISNVITEAIVLIVQIIAVKSIIIKEINEIHCWKSFIAMIISIIGTIWVTRIDIGYLMQLIISALLFSTIYILVLLILKEICVMEVARYIINRCAKKG